MKKGIPCFDYSEIGPNGQNRITFSFATGNEDIASEMVVSLGDTDPMTGEKITDLTFFREYHLLIYVILILTKMARHLCARAFWLPFSALAALYACQSRTACKWDASGSKIRMRPHLHAFPEGPDPAAATDG